MRPDPSYLVCPTCEHCERLERDGDADEAATDEVTCPACGSRRAFRHHEPALPDAESEAYVKLDGDTADDP